MFKFKTYAKAELVTDKDGVLKKTLAGRVDIPDDAPFDLLFFKAVYLTSGSNLNHVYFDKAELTKSIDTVANKAMDIEHEEQGIVGHIYAASFFGAENNEPIEADKLLDYEGKVDVVIAGVVYKDRFPKLASEIVKGEWYISMETYYASFGIKVNDVLLDYDTAVSLGMTDLIGQEVTLKKSGEVVAVGIAKKAIKDLHFSGGGFVKEPANPTSVILDTSSNKTIDIAVVVSKKDGDTTVADVDKVVVENKIDFEEVSAFIECLIEDYEKEFSRPNYDVIIKEVNAAISGVSEFITAKKWTTKYINSLPNSAFIIIEPAYKSGKTDNKNARHLPYKNDTGKVDLPHLRNALARCGQIKPVTDSISQDALRSKACSKAKSLAKKHLKKSK
jgi:hypothetical protein